MPSAAASSFSLACVSWRIWAVKRISSYSSASGVTGGSRIRGSAMVGLALRSRRGDRQASGRVHPPGLDGIAVGVEQQQVRPWLDLRAGIVDAEQERRPLLGGHFELRSFVVERQHGPLHAVAVEQGQAHGGGCRWVMQLAQHGHRLPSAVYYHQAAGAQGREVPAMGDVVGQKAPVDLTATDGALGLVAGGDGLDQAHHYAPLVGRQFIEQVVYGLRHGGPLSAGSLVQSITCTKLCARASKYVPRRWEGGRSIPMK